MADQFNLERLRVNPADLQREHKRELHRLAEARRRARVQKHVKLHTVRAGEIVYEALIAQSEDAGIPKDEAERATRNRKKVNGDLTEIILQWARRYLAKRQT